MPKITIYDIANQTGFAVSTVSKALNDYQGVSKRTKQKVLQACAELGFTPNSIAQTLASKRSRLIGVVFSDSLGLGLLHPHFALILQKFKDIVESAGYDLVFINQRTFEGGFYQHCLYRQVEGALIAIPRIELPSVQKLVESDIPCISIEDVYGTIPSVRSDNRLGTRQALSHLYSLGHRKIATIAGPQDGLAGCERYDEYVVFLEENNLPFNPKHVIFSKNYSLVDGQQATEELLAQCWNDMPTAIYCAYDEIALGCMEVLTDQGFRIPQDISVIGFDNIKTSEYYIPKLTTVSQNHVKIGQIAADLLLQKLKGEELTVENILVPTKLLVRNSTCKLQNE